MKFEVDTDTVLEKIVTRVTENLEANVRASGLSEEEVAATIVLNKKKLATDAQNLAAFFVSLYVETPVDIAVADELPL
jgi:hypothetical protein